MIATPAVTTFEPAPTAVIPLRIRREQMPAVFGPAIEEIFAVLAAQRIEPAGSVFAHHFAMEPEYFDFELGVPVTKAIAPSGRVQPGLRPAVRVARTTYQGPYEGLPDAWGRFHGWVVEQGLAFAPDIWECYIDGPHSTTDPAEYRTELNRPLADDAAAR